MLPYVCCRLLQSACCWTGIYVQGHIDVDRGGTIQVQYRDDTAAIQVQSSYSTGATQVQHSYNLGA